MLAALPTPSPTRMPTRYTDATTPESEIGPTAGGTTATLSTATAHTTTVTPSPLSGLRKSGS